MSLEDFDNAECSGGFDLRFCDDLDAGQLGHFRNEDLNVLHAANVHSALAADRSVIDFGTCRYLHGQHDFSGRAAVVRTIYSGPDVFERCIDARDG